MPEVTDTPAAATPEAPPTPAAAPPTTAPDEPAAMPEPLSRPRDWAAGTVQAQLDRDTTFVPFGKGALFVPSMTNPLDEPPVSVWHGGDKVGEGTTGKRIVLLPGTYTVHIGSGTEEQRFRTQVSVRELFTTVLPVTWSGIAVHVVDEQLSSVRQSYEIIRVDNREYYGIGFGSNEQAGEPVTTWVLRPGLYKIVRVGESYRARRDFVTVRLLPAHLSHVLLVVSADTGEFKGGGEVPGDEVFQPHAGALWSVLVLGGDLSLNARQNVPGSTDAALGKAYAARAFTDGRVSAEIFGNPLVLQLQIEEGQYKAPGQPLQKSQDRMDLDVLYVYRLTPWLGPYLRGSGETNLLPSYRTFNYASSDGSTGTPRNVRIESATGDLVREATNVNRLRLSKSFGFTSVKEGLGLNVRVFKAIFGETSVRLGFGARHRITNGLLEQASPEYADPLRYTLVPSSSQYGLEATVVAVARITRWVLINVEADSLLPSDELENAVLELEGTLAIKLTSYVSLNYVARFLRDRSLSKDDRLEQDVLLRFSFELL
ncbi:MAG: hypothetical protein HY903_16255 [Deltaproteobacteria bacterium]|nr:hypothetical protein [Deltaproteobacteria bacterium]